MRVACRGWDGWTTASGDRPSVSTAELLSYLPLLLSRGVRFKRDQSHFFFKFILILDPNQPDAGRFSMATGAFTRGPYYGDLEGPGEFDLAPVSYTHLTLPTIYSV